MNQLTVVREFDQYGLIKAANPKTIEDMNIAKKERERRKRQNARIASIIQQKPPEPKPARSIRQMNKTVFQKEWERMINMVIAFKAIHGSDGYHKECICPDCRGRREQMLEALRGTPIITYERVKRFVCDRYQIDWQTLKGGRRKREFMLPRFEFSWIGNRVMGRSLPEIGRILGGRDHTTILHGDRKYQSCQTLVIQGQSIRYPQRDLVLVDKSDFYRKAGIKEPSAYE